jgi:intracellular multiplication protein IcmJ
MASQSSLILSTNFAGWRLFQRRKADAAFLPVRDKIFNRDAYTCKFCGFQAQEYQEIINLDHDYHNNKLSNMATACCFCAQCFFVEHIGQGGFGGGKLIQLPEMRQEELNGFCHVIFCAMANGTGYSDTAQSIYRDLKFRARAIEEKFGAGMSNPAVFGQMLAECERERESLAKVLAGLRLLPVYAKFKEQLERWSAAAAEELDSA